MVLSYVGRCGHLSVLIPLDPVLFVANGAYRCHSYISSYFFPPTAMPTRNHMRRTDLHVELALARDFCSWSPFLRRTWFPKAGSPFFFFLSMEMCSLSSSQKEIAVRRTTPTSFFPLSLWSGNGQVCTRDGILFESVALAGDRRLSVPPPREVRAAAAGNLTSWNLVVPFPVVLLSRVTPVKVATCSKQQGQHFPVGSCASAVEDFRVHMCKQIQRQRPLWSCIIMGGRFWCSFGGNWSFPCRHRRCYSSGTNRSVQVQLPGRVPAPKVVTPRDALSPFLWKLLSPWNTGQGSTEQLLLNFLWCWYFLKFVCFASSSAANKLLFAKISIHPSKVARGIVWD